jgi:hypothetical protein
MLSAGASRQQIARILNAAYGDGLLSEDTFVRRLDQLFRGGLVDRRRLVGDLNLRARHGRRLAGLAATLKATGGSIPWFGVQDREVLLALDWTGGLHELLIGRHESCDVVLSDPSVSRRHARLVFRDGWVLQDLASTNGTILNGNRVGRSELRPGDLLVVGNQRLRID